MDDLISRSALLNKICKHFNISNDWDGDITEPLQTVIDIIDNFEIAYSVDAVVTELEEEREYSYADFEEYVNEKSPCLDAEYDDYFHRGLERAIKLVKKGGVE